jgi:hypothetical protein
MAEHAPDVSTHIARTLTGMTEFRCTRRWLFLNAYYRFSRRPDRYDVTRNMIANKYDKTVPIRPRLRRVHYSTRSDDCNRQFAKNLQFGPNRRAADSHCARGAYLRVAGILPACVEGVSPSNRGPEPLGTRGRPRHDNALRRHYERGCCGTSRTTRNPVSRSW